MIAGSASTADRVDDGLCLAQPVLGDRGRDGTAVLALELLGQIEVDPLRLADCARRSSMASQIRRISS